jgi:hypothetical protein
MDEMAAALQFPHYFGRTWPALDDCLRECDWEPRRSQLLIVRDASSLLADEPPDRLELFLSHLELAAECLSEEYQESFDHRRPPTPFHVLFHKTEDAKGAWLERLAGLKRTAVRLPIRNPISWE